MAQTIKIKRSTSTIAPSSLSAGELAYSSKADTQKLYIGDGSNVLAIGGKAFTDKLDLIGSGPNTVVATTQYLGVSKLGSDTEQTAAANAVSATVGRTYAVQHNSLDQMVVNVPWVTLPQATDSVLGGIKIGTGLTINASTGVVTADEVTTSAVSSAGALMRSGGTMTGDLQFGDTNKIKLGASGDFQLVHTTTGGSFIIDQGPGDLKLVTNGTGVVINGGGSTGGSATTNLATFHSNGSAASGDEYYVELNHGVNSNQKFRTASGGVEITGNIVVSGTVDGRDVATDGSKLDGISTGADVTPSWVPSSNPSYLTSETFAASNAGNFSFSGDTMSSSGSTMTLDPASSGSSGTVVIEGGLTVKGTTTTVNSTSINLEDNIIVLNKGETSAPSADAGLEVERGTAVNAYLVWDESTDRWSVALGGGSGNNNEILQSTMSPINVENVAIDGGTF